MRQTLDLLRTFWGPEATERWQVQCENEGITESPKNMLCLGKHLHALWGAARFGLKPLRDTLAAKKGEVWVQFHWLRQGVLKPDDVVDEAAVGLLAALDTNNGFATGGSDGDSSRRGRNSTVAHRQSGLRIETGQVFVITATKPDDLPSLDLLELQWNLIRVAAMSGAADVHTNNGFEDGGSTGGAMAAIEADSDVESLWLSPEVHTDEEEDDGEGEDGDEDGDNDDDDDGDVGKTVSF